MGSIETGRDWTFHSSFAPIHSRSSTVRRMDSIAGLLDGPRARGAFLLRSTMDPPWSLRIADEAPLTLVAVVRGDACVLREGEELHLAVGDVAIILGPVPYVVADDPATAPQMVIGPGQTCSAPDGRDLGPMGDLGVRTWGNSATGRTVLLTGTDQLESEISRRLLAALPPVLTVRDEEWDCPLAPLMADE